MMSHSRWLATANRIPRFYAACNEPSTVSKELVDYIMNVYIPVWFAITKESNFTNGPQYFFSILRSAQKLSDEARSVVNKVL